MGSRSIRHRVACPSNFISSRLTSRFLEAEHVSTNVCIYVQRWDFVEGFSWNDRILPSFRLKLKNFSEFGELLWSYTV